VRKILIVLLAVLSICGLIVFTIHDKFNVYTILYSIEKNTGLKIKLNDDNTWAFYPTINFNNKNATIIHKENLLQIKNANININKSYWPTSPLYINLTSPFTNYAGMEISSLVIDANYANNIFDVKKISGKIIEGDIKLKGKFDLNDNKHFNIIGEFNNISINTLLKQSQGATWERVQIKLSSPNFKLSGKINNNKLLLDSLVGTIPITGSFYLSSNAEERFGAALLSILVEKIPSLSSISQSFNFLLSKYTNIHSSLNGTLKLKNGFIQSDEILITNKETKSIVKGTYDFSNDSINGNIFFYDQNEIFLEASLKGKIENPQILIGGKVFKDNEGESLKDIRQLFDDGINSLLNKLLKTNE
jgi:hypothetical protein